MAINFKIFVYFLYKIGEGNHSVKKWQKNKSRILTEM